MDARALGTFGGSGSAREWSPRVFSYIQHKLQTFKGSIRGRSLHSLSEQSSSSCYHPHNRLATTLLSCLPQECVINAGTQSRLHAPLSPHASTLDPPLTQQSFGLRPHQRVLHGRRVNGVLSPPSSPHFQLLLINTCWMKQTNLAFCSLMKNIRLAQIWELFP